jgi:hypothetical protein
MVFIKITANKYFLCKHLNKQTPANNHKTSYIGRALVWQKHSIATKRCRSKERNLYAKKVKSIYYLELRRSRQIRQTVSDEKIDELTDENQSTPVSNANR